MAARPQLTQPHWASPMAPFTAAISLTLTEGFMTKPTTKCGGTDLHIASTNMRITKAKNST